MLRAIEQLVRGERTICGNHRVEHSEYTYGNKHTIDRYYYHSTAICIADITTQTFIVDNGGWNTQSTNRAISDYRKFFNDKCYTEVFKYFYQLVEAIVEASMDSMRRFYYGDFNNPPIEVTMKKRMLGTEKFVEIRVSRQLETFAHTYEIKYKGPKTLEKQVKDSMHELFPL